MNDFDKNIIVLDFSDCKNLGDIHLCLKEKFDLPDFYGENWDALWDSLDDKFFENGECRVEIHGFWQLEKELRDCCGAMLEVFEDIHKEYPNVVFKIE